MARMARPISKPARHIWAGPLFVGAEQERHPYRQGRFQEYTAHQRSVQQMNRRLRSGVIAASLAGLTALLFAQPPAGPGNVSFDEWMTPSNPPFPHDPE